MSTINIEYDEPEGKMHPGTWTTGVRDNKVVVKVCCPGCGMVAPISETHSVGGTGGVHPSLDCPECEFHDHVHLNDWPEVP